MLLSVIIPFHKDLENLKRSIASVYSQTNLNDTLVEIVIGNDSEFNPAFIFNKLKMFKDIKILINKKSPPKGSGNARNSALRICSGDYIAFLDADDIWHR